MIRARDPGYPLLKSKAAQARHVLPFARHLAHRHAEDAARGAYSFPARHRLAGREAEYLANVVPLLDNAVDFYEACNDGNYRPDMARDCMYNVLNHLEALSALFPDRCLPTVCQETILKEMVDRQLRVWGSPTRSWCYTDEAFMAVCKNAARFCKHQSTLEATVMMKLKLILGVWTWKRMHT